MRLDEFTNKWEKRVMGYVQRPDYEIDINRLKSSIDNAQLQIESQIEQRHKKSSQVTATDVLESKTNRKLDHMNSVMAGLSQKIAAVSVSNLIRV